MTEEELIWFLRIPEISNAKSHQNVVEHLKRTRGLPRIFMGVGIMSPRNVHLITTRLTGHALRGGLVDGPVYEHIFKSLKGVSITVPDPLAEFQNPRTVYYEDFQDDTSNDPTMDGTASAILMWAVLQSLSLHLGTMQSR